MRRPSGRHYDQSIDQVVPWEAIMSRVIGLIDIMPSTDGHNIDVALQTDAGTVDLTFRTAEVSDLVFKLFGALGIAGKLDSQSGQGPTPAVGVSGYRAAPTDDA